MKYFLILSFVIFSSIDSFAGGSGGGGGVRPFSDTISIKISVK